MNIETGKSSEQRVFFLATDVQTPSGGRKFIYHLVDLLRENGVEAYALHQRRNFRYSWFSNSTPVRYTYQIKLTRAKSNLLKFLPRVCFRILPDYFKAGGSKTERVKVSKSDLLVIPATRVSFINEVLPGTKKITLSQGPYLLLEQMSSVGLARDSNFFHADILARITMSQLNFEFHQLCFPLEAIYNVPVFIDETLYSFSKNKKKQIAYMPRRGKKESSAIINILKSRGYLHGFEFVAIDNLSQNDAAEVLKDSLMFLSFSTREGFGLPPAEAMACGCVVVGYSGNGGDEFFNNDICFKIDEGDLIGFVETIESVVKEYSTNQSLLDQLRERASKYILATYSKEHTETSLLNVWSKIKRQT